MRTRHVLLLIGIAVVVPAARSDAQPLPELPPPRPTAPGQLLPELPRPQPVAPAPRPPSFELARQAAASNYYRPVCEPEMPTPGMWGDNPCPHKRSWQECFMSYRDCMEWICTRPTCCKGMQPPADASLYDWLKHRLALHAPAAHGTCIGPGGTRAFLAAPPRGSD
jgi:hypothetical protein